MATQTERDNARARAKAKEANKRNEEFDRRARRRGVQERTIRSLQDKGKLATLFDRASTSPSEREAREDKRVSDLKTGRTRAGERILAERGKKRDAETKARLARAAQADIDRRSAASGARLEAKMKKDAENARKLANAKKTQKAVADFTGETGKQARLSNAAIIAKANKKLAMSPDDFANVPPVPPAKVEANRINKKAMTAAEVKAMKNNPLNAKRAGKAAQVEKNQSKALSLFKDNQKIEKAKGANDQAIIDSIKQADKLKSKGGTAPGIMTRDSGVAGKSAAKAEKFGVGDKFVIRGNKANVTDTQLKKTGLTQAQYMKQWRASNKRPTAASASKATTKSTTKSTKTPKKVGGLRKFLLGPDGKFGGARGAIDFLPGKSRKKKEDKPVKKNMGGMMKSKMASKGGAMKSKGMSKGGAMKKKGYAMGGAVMKKKGYSKGGVAMKSKGGSKGGASRKPRGVGVAMRGYGKAMR